jgi:hypothetical protein
MQLNSTLSIVENLLSLSNSLIRSDDYPEFAVISFVNYAELLTLLGSKVEYIMVGDEGNKWQAVYFGNTIKFTVVADKDIDDATVTFLTKKKEPCISFLKHMDNTGQTYAFTKH